MSTARQRKLLDMEKFTEVTIRACLETLEEQNDVDYKAEISKEKVNVTDTVKDVASIANFGGGVLIYGVRRGEYIGIEDIRSYDAANFANKFERYLDPPPQVTSGTLERCGKYFPYIKIQPTDRVPTVIAEDVYGADNKIILHKGTIFTRHNTKNTVVNSEQLMGTLLRRFVSGDAARKRNTPTFSTESFCAGFAPTLGLHIYDIKFRVKESSPSPVQNLIVWGHVYTDPQDVVEIELDQYLAHGVSTRRVPHTRSSGDGVLFHPRGDTKIELSAQSVAIGGAVSLKIGLPDLNESSDGGATYNDIRLNIHLNGSFQWLLAGKVEHEVFHEVRGQANRDYEERERETARAAQKRIGQ